MTNTTHPNATANAAAKRLGLHRGDTVWHSGNPYTYTGAARGHLQLDGKTFRQTMAVHPEDAGALVVQQGSAWVTLADRAESQ